MNTVDEGVSWMEVVQIGSVFETNISAFEREKGVTPCIDRPSPLRVLRWKGRNRRVNNRPKAHIVLELNTELVHTDMTATLKNGGRSRAENRDPSPEYGNVYGGHSDDMDEPWDEPPATPRPLKSPLLACVEEYFDPAREEQELDDGELPSLNIRQKKQASSLLNGNATPTKKPLQPPNKAGLDPPQPEQVRSRDRKFWNQLDPPSPDTMPSKSSASSAWDDDAPDDEIAVQKKRELGRDANEVEDRDLAAVSEDNFCDAAINICGKESESPDRMPYVQKRKLRSINDLRTSGNVVEEQTAIEVEYVEPSSTERGWSQSKKNSYLSAMARKARADFNKSAPSEPLFKDVEPDEEEEKDVYSSFTPAEKRKFLKMVNSGMTPTQSAKQVLEERDAPKDASKRGMAFWKKSAPRPEVPASPDRFGMPEESPIRETDDVVLDGPDDFDREIHLEVDSLDRLVESDDLIVSGDLEKDYPDNRGKRRQDEIAAAAIAGTVAAVATTAALSSPRPEDVDSDIQEKFVISGSNYYDAVRRDRADDIDEVYDPTNPSKNTAAVRTAKTVPVRSPKQGFTALSEREEINVANSGDYDDTVVQSVATSNRRSRVDRTVPLSPSDVAAKRRFRLRANRSGFEVLEEDEPSHKPIHRSVAGGIAAAGTTVVVGKATAIGSNEDLADDLAPELKEEAEEKAEEDAADMLERELLRPVGASPPLAVGTTGTIPENDVFDGSYDRSFDIETPRSLATSPRGKTFEVVGGVDISEVDVSIDNYLESATVYTNDQVSVVSGKSHWTAATGTSAYTTSSRIRRPGAAKHRLAKARKADQSTSKKGWHESMKKAAAQSNQAWDPKEGFPGYTDPAEDMRDLSSDDPIRVEIKGLSKQTKPVDPKTTTESSISVSLPKQSEAEVQGMIVDGVDDSPAPPAASAANRSTEAPVIARDLSGNDHKPKGKAPAIVKRSSAPDPEGGVQRTSAPDPEGLPPAALVGGIATAGGTVFAAEEYESAQSRADRSVVASEVSALSRSAVQDDKYVQIGDTGSVKTFVYNQTPSNVAGIKKRKADEPLGTVTPDNFDSLMPEEDEINEDDSAPLLPAGDTFITSTDQPELGIVKVVKQKNTQDDINLFAHDSRNALSPEAKAKEPSKRRGFGPVDIDEIDDMDFEDDDANEDKMWAAAAITTADASGDRMKKSETTRSSFPKLQASKKDTSPVSDRKNESSLQQHADRSSIKPGNNVGSGGIGALCDITGSIPSDSHTPSVKNLAAQWESGAIASSPRSQVQPDAVEYKNGENNEVSWPSGDEPMEERLAPGTAEWKSFLGKKVRAESAAAAKREYVAADRPDPTSQNQEPPRPDPSEEKYRAGKDPEENVAGDSDDDSIFEFKPSLSDQAGAFPTQSSSRAEDTFSDISPIPTQEEEESIGRMEQVSDTGTNVEQGSFLKRLQACAAPIMPRQFIGQTNDDSVPSAHLAFMRSNQQGTGQAVAANRSSARYIPPNLCGRPDTIAEDSEEPLESPAASPSDEPRRSSSSKRGKQRSSPREVASEVRSVSSDDGFGAKTSYLEAIAMKAAVSNPKRSGSRGRGSDDRSRSSAVSDTSSSSRTKEKWQEFLDRKAAGISPNKSRTESTHQRPESSGVSRAAEKYAAEKVEEMLDAMSKKEGNGISQDVASPGAMSPYDLRQVRSDGSKSTRSVTKKNESARAAEELAAARVEAMMAAMTTHTLDEGEI
jgi:hypothetical protein